MLVGWLVFTGDTRKYFDVLTLIPFYFGKCCGQLVVCMTQRLLKRLKIKYIIFIIQIK